MSEELVDLPLMLCSLTEKVKTLEELVDAQQNAINFLKKVLESAGIDLKSKIQEEVDAVIGNDLGVKVVVRSTYDSLVQTMADCGWSVRDFEDERTRQFMEELEKNPPPAAEFAFIHDEGPEPE